MPIEYAISRVTQRQSEQFVDEHNKYRSLVNPPAANMEYMVRQFASLYYMLMQYCIKQTSVYLVTITRRRAYS